MAARALAVLLAGLWTVALAEDAPDSAAEGRAVVRGPRKPAPDRAQPATAIEGEQLRESPKASTFEAIAQESADVFVPARGAGLHGVGNGSTGAIHVRGLGGSPNAQVLVVEDGVPDYQGIFGHPIADAYPPVLVDQAWVVKGGDSVRYGTNALGGVLVLRSRWRESDGWELASDAAAGSWSTLRLSTAALGREGRWDLAAAFFGLDTAGHRAGAGGSEAVGIAATRAQLGGGLTLTARDKLAHLVGNDPGPVTHPTLDHGYDVWRDTASLQLALDRASVQLTATPYLDVGTHRLYDGFYSRDAVYGVIAEGQGRATSALRLLAGAAVEGVGGTVENRITGDAPDVRGSVSGALYVEGTLRLAPELVAVAGARAVASTRWGTIPLWKAGLRWDALPGLSLTANATANYREPTLRELYLPYPVANPDLKPERAVNASLGAGWAWSGLDLQVSGYRTHASDLIKYFGEFPAAEVVNIGEVTVWGVEGRAAVRGLGPLSAYLAADAQDVGRYTRQNPGARATFGAEFAGAVGRGRGAAAVDGEWVHGLYMADYGVDRMPDVFVVDLTLRWRVDDVARGVTAEPYLVARNLLDKQYAYVEGYVMPGFNVMAGLRIWMR